MKSLSRSATESSSEPASIGACAFPAQAGRQALQVSFLFLLLAALPLLLLAAGAGAQEVTRTAETANEPGEAAGSAASRNIVPLGPDGLPAPRRQLPDLGRLQRQLHQEALIEGFLGESDLRNIVAVRAYVDRTGRVPDGSIHDHARHFADSRRAVQQMAKEAAREYVKMRIGWEAMQDRMKLRMRNLVRRGGADRPAARYGDVPAGTAPAAPTAPESGGWGALEVGPELSLDLDDAEVGLDFDYDPDRINFLSRWNLYYGRTLVSNEEIFRLRYDNSDSKRWFELRAGRGHEDAGDYVAISMTALF